MTGQSTTFDNYSHLFRVWFLALSLMQSSPFDGECGVGAQATRRRVIGFELNVQYREVVATTDR